MVLIKLVSKIGLPSLTARLRFFDGNKLLPCILKMGFSQHRCVPSSMLNDKYSKNVFSYCYESGHYKTFFRHMTQYVSVSLLFNFTLIVFISRPYSINILEQKFLRVTVPVLFVCFLKVKQYCMNYLFGINKTVRKI